MVLSPYLRFDGNCREAFAYYAEKLGGTVDAVMTWGESPMADQAGPELLDKVMHASMHIGSYELMGRDASSDAPYQGVEGASLVLTVSTAVEAERMFAALADQGKIEIAMEETFWAERFGAVTDRYGVPWMINCNKPMAH